MAGTGVGLDGIHADLMEVLGLMQQLHDDAGQIRQVLEEVKKALQELARAVRDHR